MPEIAPARSSCPLEGDCHDISYRVFAVVQLGKPCMSDKNEDVRWRGRRLDQLHPADVVTLSGRVVVSRNASRSQPSIMVKE